MKLGNLQGAHQYLVAFEKHTQNDPSCRIAIARLAKLRGDSEKLFTQLNRAFEENLLLIPEDLTVDYLKKMYATGNTDAKDIYWLNCAKNILRIRLWPCMKLKTCPKPRLGVCHQNIG